MNRRRNVVIIVVAVVVLLCCCAASIGAAVIGLGLIPWRWSGGVNLGLGDIQISGVEATSSMRREFAAEGLRPVLDVECPICDLEITGSSGSVVDVEATTRAWAADENAAELARDQVSISLAQEGELIRIHVDMPQQQTGLPGQRARVDLVISVPRQCDLELDLDVGDVDVTGIEGSIDISADVGEVNLNQVVAREAFQVRTDVARIRLQGPLAEGVSYDIRSVVGEIGLRLPADSSFEIDAESNVGSVTTDFDVQAMRERQQFIGGRIEGTVGASPTAELRLRSEIGSIRVEMY